MTLAVWRRVLTASCAAAAAGAVLAGCTQQPAPDRPVPRLYPFDSAVYFTPQQSVLLQSAEERAVQRCMRRHGFAYTPAPPSPVQEPRNPYGLLDERTARTNGYGITAAAARGAFASPAPSPPAGRSRDSARSRRVLLGTEARQRTISLPTGEQVTVRTDACVTRAREMVYGPGWDDLFYLFQALSNEVIERVEDDPAVTGAWRRWAACMEKQGFAKPTRDDVLSSVERRVRRAAGRGESVRAAARAEIKTAVRDARCQEQAGLRRHVEAAQHAAEQRRLGSYEDELSRLRSMRDHGLAQASLPAKAPSDESAEGSSKTTAEQSAADSRH
ncbi:hypothetical protein [Streptomyces sp. NPDC007991]|uniref:hypothetical protein n=1 Tax=Streptomyces sp. NPDC007991 TaxID=3364803 RepID=UPI0036E113AE